MLKLGALLIAAALAASAPIPIARPSQPPAIGGGDQHQAPVSDSNGHNESAATYERGTEDSPLIIKILPSDATKEAPNSNAEKERGETPDWWMIVPTWLLAIFTGGLFFYTFRLWGSTTRLISEEREASIREQRAYVSLAISTVPWPPNEPNRHSVRLVVTNSGKTWARKLTVKKKSVPHFPPQTDPFDVLKNSIEQPDVFLLGPSQTVVLQFDDVPFPLVQQIANMSAGYDYIAWAQYEDSVSDPPIQHQTRLFQTIGGDAEGGIAFRYVGKHNCADNDCQ